MKRLLSVIMVIGLMLPGPAAASERLLAAAPYPAHLLLKRCKLFWSDDGETPINMISVNGGAKVPLIGKIGLPENLIIHNQFMYWVDQRPNPQIQYYRWSLKKTTLDGTSTVTLASDWGSGGNILFDNDDIYIFQLTLSHPYTLSLKKISSTGDSVTLYSKTPVYYDIPFLAKDAAFLYWYEGHFPDRGVIKKMPIGGGAVTTIYEVPEPVSSNLVVDGSDLILAVRYPYYYRFLKVPVSGGSPTELANLSCGQYDYVSSVLQHRCWTWDDH